MPSFPYKIYRMSRQHVAVDLISNGIYIVFQVFASEIYLYFEKRCKSLRSKKDTGKIKKRTAKRTTWSF